MMDFKINEELPKRFNDTDYFDESNYRIFKLAQLIANNLTEEEYHELAHQLYTVDDTTVDGHLFHELTGGDFKRDDGYLHVKPTNTDEWDTHSYAKELAVMYSLKYGIFWKTIARLDDINFEKLGGYGPEFYNMKPDGSPLKP